MQVAGIVPFSTVDYPDQLAAVFFVQGCNYDCFYCHNRFLLNPEQINTEDYIDNFLRSHMGKLDGIVVSGGEPTIYRDLRQLLTKIKSMGYLAKLDTNGSNPEIMLSMIVQGLVDYVALDFKAPFDKYNDICGTEVDTDAIRRSLLILLQSNIPWELRTTVIPQLDLGDLINMAKSIPIVPRYVLQKYVIPPVFPEHETERIHAEETPFHELALWMNIIQMVQPNTILR